MSGPHASHAVAAERRVPMHGVTNFRDLGGYDAEGHAATKWGTVFRSDALSGLDDADRLYLQRMGIRQVIDWRSAAEVSGFPDKLPSDVGYTNLQIVLPIDPRLVFSGQVVADE